jgi:PAS domain-containing protein
MARSRLGRARSRGPMMSVFMSSTARPTEPAIITIPTSDAAFHEHVQGIAPLTTPRDLETRLRRIFPRVVVRERTISGAPGWYVYRDGSWSSSLAGEWWDDPDLPRVVLSLDGWFLDASPTALGLLGIEEGDVSTHYLTDLVVPGTLEDALALFRIVREGKTLDATILVRPLTGDVIAVDLHANLAGDRIEAVLRLAGDVLAPPGADAFGRPAQLTFVPATDVAFRSYGQRALERMPEATPDELAIRLRRLYPHATVEARDDAGSCGGTTRGSTAPPTPGGRPRSGRESDTTRRHSSSRRTTRPRRSSVGRCSGVTGRSS